MAATGNSYFWLVNFYKSFPLKPLGQMIRNLVGSIYRRSSIKIAHSILIRYKHGRHRRFLFLIGWFLAHLTQRVKLSYYHHLASVFVVRRKLFQKSSRLKVLDQWKPNLVRINTRVSKLCPVISVHQPTWPLLLKIEHMVKLQVLGNNSKTVNNIKNLTWG